VSQSYRVSKGQQVSQSLRQPKDTNPESAQKREKAEAEIAAIKAANRRSRSTTEQNDGKSG